MRSSEDSTCPREGTKPCLCFSGCHDVKTLVIDDSGLLRDALYGMIRALKAAHRTNAVIAATARGFDPRRRVEQVRRSL